MKKYCIITNRNKDRDYSITDHILETLQREGMEAYTVGGRTDDTYIRPINITQDLIEEGTDCIIVLGGDGTLIKIARNLAHLHIPFLGVNLGTLGFLASVEKDDVERAVREMVEGTYTLEKRMMIKGRPTINGRPRASVPALNEIMISRAGFSRMVELKLYINDNLAEVYQADGILISTPTGSTAYNLSAGGPVVFPESRVMIIVPVCPHALSSRAIVTSPFDKIRVEIGKRRSSAETEEAEVLVDGIKVAQLSSFDKVEIERSRHYIELVRLSDYSFYDSMRKKIGHGEGQYEI
ncbi:MAG: NAD(+)/NADH kinase [Lachnospiraceae bacterium]|nr:NAD(+)/NADH kinase [Lachnospiraceae bacterium]